MVSIPPQVSPHGKRFSAKILTARFERLVLRWSTNGRPGRSLTPSLLGWKKPCRHVGGHCIWEARAMKPRLQNKKNPKVETFSSPETLVPLPKKRRWRELGKKTIKNCKFHSFNFWGVVTGPRPAAPAVVSETPAPVAASSWPHKWPCESVSDDP